MAKQPIGDFLATLRKAHGYTQQQVADELGISNRTLSAWEQGRAYPDILTLPALADLYGVTADEILSGERAKTGDSAGVIEELSEKSRAKLCKNKLSKYSDLCVLLTITGSLGAAVFLGGTLLTAFIPWLGIVLAVLGAAAAVVSGILAGVFYRNALTACWADGYESGDGKQSFPLTALKSKNRAFDIIGFIWLACGALIFLMLITGALLTEAAINLIYIPFAISFALLIYAYIEFVRTVNKYGSEAQIAVQKRNGKLLAKCAGICAVPVVAAIVIMIVLTNCMIHTRVYSGVKEDFKSYMHVFIAGEFSCVEAGEYPLDIPEELPMDGRYIPVGNGLYAQAAYEIAVIKDEEGTYREVKRVYELTIYHLHKDINGNVSYNLTATAPALKDNGGNLIAFNARYAKPTGVPDLAEYAITEKNGVYTLIKSEYLNEVIVCLPCVSVIAVSVILGASIYFAKKKKI